jgi:hypothetical protein
MKTLRLFTSALLASSIAVPCAYAQVTVGSGAANLPAQGTLGPPGSAPNAPGSSSSISPGNYGPGAYGPGAYGPGNYGPGNYGPGNYSGGVAGPANTAGTGTR